MQELEKILEEIDAHAIEFEIFGTSDDYISVGWVKDIIRKYMNDGWISAKERLPEVFGKYWATIRYDDGRISEPIVVDFRGVRQKYVVDTPNGREYETWGIDSAFHGSRVIAWRPYYIPEPYSPEKERERMSEIKLKPCPFCGSEDIQEGSRTSDLCTDIYIRCRTCGGKMQICEEYGEEELVNRWNRRAENE